MANIKQISIDNTVYDIKDDISGYQTATQVNTAISTHNTSTTAHDDIREKIKDIELFKFPNAIIIGNPTIQSGQVSGFTTTSYMQFPFVVDVRNKNFEIDFCFTTGTDVTTQQNILDSKFGLALAISNGKGLMAMSSNGTQWDIGSTSGTMTISANTTYYAKVTWDGTTYKTALSTDGSTYTDDMTLTSSLGLFPTTIYIGGGSSTSLGHTPTPFSGSINFNKCYLYVAGLLVWQGMDDAGLATRADVSLSNLDSVGTAKITYTAGTGIDITNNVISNTQTSAEWGNISGTLSNQTDLQTALNGKQSTLSAKGSTTQPIYVSASGTTATCNTMCDLASTQTVSGKKTFTGIPVFQNSAYGALVVKRTDTNSAGLTFANSSGTLGSIGMRSTGIPFIGVSTGSVQGDKAIVRATENSAVGSATNPVYINSSGVATATNLKYGADLSYSNSKLQLKDQDGNALGNAVTIESSPAIDNKSITTNSSSQLQTVGVINQNDTTTALKTWSGTTAEYNAIETKDNATLYNITDDTDISLTLLQTIYPVGALYFGNMATCPLAPLFGTWQLVASDRVIQGAGSRGSVGTTVDESLPNITGTWNNTTILNSGNATMGAFETASFSSYAQSAGSSAGTSLTFDASRSSSTYQDDAPVQQNAYIVNVWERIA